MSDVVQSPAAVRCGGCQGNGVCPKCGGEGVVEKTRLDRQHEAREIHLLETRKTSFWDSPAAVLERQNELKRLRYDEACPSKGCPACEGTTLCSGCWGSGWIVIGAAPSG